MYIDFWNPLFFFETLQELFNSPEFAAALQEELNNIPGLEVTGVSSAALESKDIFIIHKKFLSIENQSFFFTSVADKGGGMSQTT